MIATEIREASDFRDESLEMAVTGTIASTRCGHECLTAFRLIANAFKGSGSIAGSNENSELLAEIRVLKRLAPTKDGSELLRGEVRGENEVDEEALVADAAPVVESALGILMEGSVTRSEDMVVLIEAGEDLGDRYLGAVPEPREVLEALDPASNECAEAGFEDGSFRPLVIDGPAGPFRGG